MKRYVRILLPAFCFWLLLALVYFLYLPGQTGSYYFDDRVNLEGLQNVHDLDSALLFISEGFSGPLGRPLAFASFLINIGDLSDTPSGFLKINILIHLLNGALLTWLCLRIARLAWPAWSSYKTAWFAISVSYIWWVLPLLVSTSLIVIQRMASLCATFVLLGLLIYCIGLSWQNRYPWRGAFIQLTGIGLGALLAALTKENGILLPVYALVLNLTLFAHLDPSKSRRIIRTLLLAIPLLALCCYFLLNWNGLKSSYAIRPFNLEERLLTQAVILWDYLRLAFWPSVTAFSPFHDDYPIAKSLFSSTTTFLAVFAWIGLLLLAFNQRQRWPVFAFAILWFTGGHILESTVIPLELYYEHRNYLPIIGPVFAFSWLVWKASEKFKWLAPAVLGSYSILLSWLLWQTTSLWGRPEIAIEIWGQTKPQSIRAQQYLANRYFLMKDIATARDLLEKTSAANQNSIDITLQILLVDCGQNSSLKTEATLAKAREQSPSSDFSNAALTTIGEILRLHNQGLCPEISYLDLHRLTDGLLKNPHFPTSGRAGYYLHNLKADIFLSEGNFAQALSHLDQAFKANPEIDTLVRIFKIMRITKTNEEAQNYLKNAMVLAPQNPIIKRQWHEIITDLQQ